MILGLGTDLVDVARIRRSISAFGLRFTGRVFTDAEQAYANSKANSAERYAARFAAKEAAMKALGVGWANGITWRHIEVSRDEATGKPGMLFHGVALQIAKQMGVQRIWLSMTHISQYAGAVVVLED